MPAAIAASRLARAATSCSTPRLCDPGRRRCSASRRSRWPGARGSRIERTLGRRGGAARPRARPLLGLLGFCLATTAARSRVGILRGCSRSSRTRRSRLLPAAVFEIGSSLREARIRQGIDFPHRAGDEDPRQVPACARGRAVRATARAHLHQGLPPLVRGLPRPRRRALRRRVQLALRRRRGRDDADARRGAFLPRDAASASVARRARCWSRSPRSPS